jgi:hypothetical protein
MRTRRRPALGAEPMRGDIDPITGQVYDGVNWLTPNDGESENLSTALKSYMNDPFAAMTEADKALYWAGQGAGGSSAYYAGPQVITNTGPGGTYVSTYDAAAAAAGAAAAAADVIAQADRLAYLNNLVQTAQATDIAQKSYANDYVAQSNGDLATWFSLAYPGEERYQMASNGGALLDNALLKYMALKAGGGGSPALDASAAAAQAAADAAFQASLSTGGYVAAAPPSAEQINGALEAIDTAGGDSSQPTAIIDQQTGAVIAVASRNTDGTVSVTVPPPGSSSRSLSGVVNSVTGVIDKVAGTISDIGVQVQKVGNAIKGGAAGASAGYNLGDPKTLMIGGGLLLALLLLPRRGRR